MDARPGLTLLVPPSFDYLDGLFLPDLARARLLARLVHTVCTWREKGALVELEVEAGGRTAIEMATAARRATRVMVVPGPHDERAARLLLAALREEGADPALAAGSPGEAMAAVEEAAASLPLAPGSVPGLPAAPRGWLVAPPGLVPAQAGVVFEEGSGGVLVRRSPGAVGFLPPEVRELRFLAPEAGRTFSGEAGAPETRYVLELPPAPERWALAASLGRLCRAGRVLLHLDPDAQEARSAPAWARRYGLDRPRFREALAGLVARWFPEKSLLLHAALASFREGIDPLAEMYAGNGLADRNAQLLENIVP